MKKLFAFVLGLLLFFCPFAVQAEQIHAPFVPHRSGEQEHEGNAGPDAQPRPAEP